MELVAQDRHVRHCGVTRVTVRNLLRPWLMSERARPLSGVRGLTRARAIKSVASGDVMVPVGRSGVPCIGSGEAEPASHGSGEAEPASLVSGEAAVASLPFV